MITAAREALARCNDRHPWSHNDYYHRWLIRHLPARREAALDVGCGRGVLLGRLATRFATVVGIDVDERMAREAATAVPAAEVHRVGLVEFAAGNDARFDVVTMVAVLHHLELHEALPAVRRLLAPGGRLLVVGLGAPGPLRELPLDLLSSALNPLVGLVKHPRRARPGGKTVQPPPMRDPTTTFAEVAAAARTLLPGSVLRRRLFFRYTLRWDSTRTPAQR